MSDNSPENRALPTANGDLPADFAQIFTDLLQDSALPGEGDGLSRDALQDVAQFMGKAAQQRGNDTPAIRLDFGHGEGRDRRMWLAVVNDDMPFLVDTISQIAAAQNLIIHRLLHPLAYVERDPAGHLLSVAADKGTRGQGQRESLIFIELERVDARARRQFLDAVQLSLGDVRAAVYDWKAMRAEMLSDAAMRLDGEAAELLRWFESGAMLLLGHEWRSRDGGRDKPRGISAASHGALLSKAGLEAAFRWFDQGGEAPLLIKSNRLSTVHRFVMLDLIIVPEMVDGKAARLSVHAGLWTSAALSVRPDKVPMLRAELAALMHKFGFDPAGHAGKSLSHTLTALPHDILIAFRAEELEHLVLTSMSITDRPRPRVEMVRSALGRHLFAFVWLPRDELSTLRRQAVQQILIDAAKATLIGWSMALEDGGSAMLRFTLDLGRDGIEPDRDTLNEALEQLVRGWVPKVEAALAAHGDAGRAAALASRFAAEFPDHYRSRYGADEAAQDILRLHGLSDALGRSVRLAQSSLNGDDRLRLKVYSATGPIPLSDIVPAMEHFGFQVLEDVPTALNPPRDGGAHGDARLYIHDFLLKNPPAIDEKALLPHVQMIEDAIAAVLTGQHEDDSFNQLVLFTHQEPQTISWLRAWFRFLRQGGFLYGMDTVVGALRSAPQLTNKLIALFRAFHDPKTADEPKAAQLQREIEAAFADIQSIDEDRIFRLYLAVINATLRTNAFAPAAAEALAFKLDSSLIPGLPKPLPWREVFVYSQRVEGVHMRAGPVARGGLRWSDRRDDFRTEVLGLMKAQRVKNAVIVPTGAKGGFYAKNLPSPSVDRDAWFAEGTECYRIFIRSLLSVTDNIVAGKILHPKGVTIRDGEDPYFVVAADKGTATFSDVANALAMERDFWLGDAFASGGSKGYDHKAMGITARGAWLSVQRHFAELGVDVQTQPIEVVGCGDMSGDVFGNGMLLSKAIKLVAAYDHRHIFLDPNPDPETSWSERKRLFELPRSSWDDYDKGLISAGGGVFPRSQKTIPLSPEVRDILGIEAESLDPSALISAILKSPADLLWFGGIGTYLKAASQNNADVGDPANDAVRVDAEDLRVQVVGEGANLGVTQAARIAFAAQGGRINADFIDNSAGVDCSDNEVNIKIALNREMAEGRLAQADRDSLLMRMTDDVARLVLEDNRLQALALSIAERSAQSALPSLLRVMDGFESGGRLDRKVEGLASNEDYLRRAAEGGGLTRPELAILMSTTKLALQEAIEDSSLPDDPALADDLAAAFPDEMQRDFADAIQQHQLRREIIATKIANRMVNRLGVIHPQELMEEEGCSLADVAAAFVAVEDIADMRRLWAELDAAPMGEDARLNLFHQAGTGMASLMSEYLRLQPRETPSQAIARLKPSVSEVAAKVKELISGAADVQWSRLEKGLVESGAPAALAADVARLYKLDGVLSVAHLAQQQGDDVTVLARAFTTMSEALGLDWAQSAAAQMSPADPWERLLVNGLARDFQQILLGFLAKLPADQLQQSVSSWLGDNAARVAIFRATVEKAQRLPSPNGAILSHIAGQARGLLAR